MARWKPRGDEPVGGNEHIGRRLFDEPMLVGALNQRPFAGLDLRHFQETRDLEFSVDRLGRSGIEKPKNYLRPRAEAAGQKFARPKAFNGWAVLRARQLECPPVGAALPVIASPVTGGGLDDENPYHAHLLLPAVGDYHTALHLRNLFGTYGNVEAVGQIAELPQPAKPVSRIVETIRDWVKRWGWRR